MNDIKRRAPVAITVPEKIKESDKRTEKPRSPRAVSPAKIKIAEEEIFEGDSPLLGNEPAPSSMRWPLGTVFISAASALIMLWLSSSVYVWVENLIATKPQLGFLAAGLAALSVLALAGFIGREIFAVARLSTNRNLRQTITNVKLSNNTKLARDAVAELLKIAGTLPQTANGRANFLATDTEFLTANDLILLAEKDIIAPLDKIAIARITAAAKRVSLVTAISPRAIIDIVYVLYENAKLIRAIAEIYGCRPGVFGFMRLAKETLAHLAVTGVVAMGDSLVQQIVGHGLAARVSAKLGEGVLNGLMTARIGLASMDVVRPAPFSETEQPKITQILAALNPIGTKQGTE